jgi:hypothetical protein
MATAGELIEEISDIVLDSRYDEDMILVMLNKAMQYVASMLILPDLETSATVTTIASVNTLQLPDNFHRNLFRVTATDQAAHPGEIKLFGSVAALASHFGGTLTETGNRVTAVAPSGKSLVYAKIPEQPESLTIRYHRLPVDMTSDIDEPDGLPPAYFEILLHRVCYNIFSRIEDGTEGDKVNTNFHYRQMMAMLDYLERYIRDGVSLPDAPVVVGEFL